MSLPTSGSISHSLGKGKPKSPHLGEIFMVLRPQAPVCSLHILSGLLLQRQGTACFDLDLEISGPRL